MLTLQHRSADSTPKSFWQPHRDSSKINEIVLHINQKNVRFVRCGRCVAIA